MLVLVKSGVSPADCPNVCKHIVENCPQLILSGLMTIGMFGRDPSEENPDFQVSLEECCYDSLGSNMLSVFGGM